MRRSSTALRAALTFVVRTNRNRIRVARVRRAEFVSLGRDPFALIVNFAGCSLGLQAWGTCRFPGISALAAVPAVRHNPSTPLIPGCRCSQGGVQVPTGGKGDVAQARERLLPLESPWEKGSADSVRFRSRR